MMTSAPPPTAAAKRTPQSSPIPPTAAAPFWRPLRATILKELRQNFLYLRIIIPSFLLLGTLAGFLQYTYSARGYFDLNNMPNILCLAFIQLPILFACPLIGLLLGSIQPRDEQQIDDWAFLVHRPVRRITLFLGRIIAGIFLYTLAAGIPLIAVAIYASTRSGGEFFHPAMLLAPAADFLTGIPYYFIGLLMAEYQGWRFGPRKLPVLFGILLSIAVYNVHTFSAALLLLGIATAIVITACAGGAISRGFSLRAPLLSRFARTFLFFAGFTVPLVFIDYAGDRFISAYESSDFRSFFIESRNYVQRTIQRTLLPDGHVGEIVRQWDHLNSSPQEYFATLDGKRLPFLMLASPTETYLRNAWIRRPEPYAYHDPGSSLFSKGTAARQLPDGTWNQLAEDWYYVYPARRIYVQDHKTHLPVGTFGQDGFAPPGRLAEPFEGPVFSIYPMITPHGVYAIDKEKRTLTQLLATPADDPIVEYQPVTEPLFRRTALITCKHLYLLDEDHPAKPIILPMPPSANDQLLRLFIDTANNHFAIGCGETNPWNPRKENIEVTSFDASGRILDQQTVDSMYEEVPPRYEDLPRQMATYEQWRRVMGVSMGLSTPAPYLYNIFTARWSGMRGVYLLQILPSYFLVTALLALATIHLARRRQRPALPWSLATLLLGPAGPRTLLATHSRIPRLPCPTCQKPRPITATTCPHCHAPIAPKRTGTEIFA